MRDPPERGGEYTYLLFDQHAWIKAEEVSSESFFPGDTALDAMSRMVREEIFTVLPEVGSAKSGFDAAVLPVLKPCDVRAVGAEIKAAETRQLRLRAGAPSFICPLSPDWIRLSLGSPARWCRSACETFLFPD
ncbi:MAG: hypothetical protein AAF501_06065 [Pseudomonadota bacterium]